MRGLGTTDEKAPLISVIVPVYNVLPYLDECVDSIVFQADSRIEVILIDDGSTDGSGERCDELALRSDFVSVAHKTNGGLASARNAGMKTARGRYVSFVDSDDRLAPGSIPRMVAWASCAESDICFLQCEKFYPNGIRKPFGCEIASHDMEGLSAEESLEFLSHLGKFPDAACTKLYKRSFLERNELSFPEDGRFSEDLGFAIDCLLLAGSFAAIDGLVYEYRQDRPDSITSRPSGKHFYDLMKFVNESVDKLTDPSRNPKNSRCESCLSFVAYELSIMTWMLSLFKGEERRHAMRDLRRFLWVMPYGRGRKAAMTRSAINLFGVKLTSRLLAIYMRLR